VVDAVLSDRERYVEYINDSKLLAELELTLQKACQALKIARATHLENFVVRLGIIKYTPDMKKEKLQAVKNKLVNKQVEFSSMTALDGVQYDPSILIHPQLWSILRSFTTADAKTN
jgi:hypothetical protein